MHLKFFQQFRLCSHKEFTLISLFLHLNSKTKALRDISIYIYILLGAFDNTVHSIYRTLNY